MQDEDFYYARGVVNALRLTSELGARAKSLDELQDQLNLAFETAQNRRNAKGRGLLQTIKAAVGR
jgi:hypothetical protein